MLKKFEKKRAGKRLHRLVLFQQSLVEKLDKLDMEQRVYEQDSDFETSGLDEVELRDKIH